MTTSQFQNTLGVILLSIAFSFISASSFAQESQTLTFPNTDIQIQVPAGFETATNSGIPSVVNISEDVQLVATIIPGAYSEVKQQLTPKTFASSGIVITESEPTKTSGLEGVLFTATQTQGEVTKNKLILIFGDGSKTYMIMSVYNPTTSAKTIKGYLNTLKV